MNNKLKVGILFGGPSKEREISFQGGKTVFEHLDKSLFEPVLIFVDSLGNFIEINPDLIYADSIRDFYPSKNLNNGYRVYIESLGKLNETQLYKLIYKVGKQIKAEKLADKIDIAFPIMHGPYAEDGSIQGLLNWFNIPFVGPSMLGSAIGINKPYQNTLLSKSNGQQKKSKIITRKEWESADKSALFSKLTKSLGFPLVVKAPHQGSSIGVGIVLKRSIEEFSKRMNQCFFDHTVSQKEWSKLTRRQKKNVLEKMQRLGEGLGFPVVMNGNTYPHPADLLKELDSYLKTNDKVKLSFESAEDYVLIEEFIKGKEFSLGLIQDENLKVYALPPTEIYGDIESFDFKQKYQSAVSKKRIPIDTSISNLENLAEQAIQAFIDLGQNVVCRIDGFITDSNEIIFHDPNTIPGMSPSSLIFKQMAEIGFNITQSLNYLIRQSLVQRISEGKHSHQLKILLTQLTENMQNAIKTKKKNVAIVFGEKEDEYLSAQKKYGELAASEYYNPTCICLAKNGNHYIIPIQLMAKANIKEFGMAIGQERHAFIQSLVDKTRELRSLYGGDINFQVKKINESDFLETYDSIFSTANEVLSEA